MGSKAHPRKRREYSKKLQPEQRKDAPEAAFDVPLAAEISAQTGDTGAARDCGSSIASNAAASLGSSSRHCPRRSQGGRRNGPKRTRIRRLTGIPSVSNIRLTS